MFYPPKGSGVTQEKMPQDWQHFPQVLRLIDFAKQSASAERGFGYLDSRGALDPNVPPSLLVTSRMTFSFATGSALGIEGCRTLVERGVKSLLEDFHDTTNGGFHSSLGESPNAATKSAYDTAFVLFASSSAYAAGVSEAREVAGIALDTMLNRFWRDDLGIFSNSFNADFSLSEPYLGANANMHSVEALMAASTALNDPSLLDKAQAISQFLIDHHARKTQWLVPEHFDLIGRPLWEFNADIPDDEFRPYGVTVGHLFEWSRLLMELSQSGVRDSEWMPDAARGLYQTAKRIGWAADGKEGFVYTLDWDEKPIITERLLWVLAEAICAAVEITAEGTVEGSYQDVEWWQRLLESTFVDPTHGGWHHQLTADGVPSSTIARGKPDAYHLIQALIAPHLPRGAGILERLQRR